MKILGCLFVLFGLAKAGECSSKMKLAYNSQVNSV